MTDYYYNYLLTIRVHKRQKYNKNYFFGFTKNKMKFWYVFNKQDLFFLQNVTCKIILNTKIS